MHKAVSPDKSAILSHLRFLFADQPDGLIEIAYTPESSSAVSKADFFKISDIEKAAEFAANQNAKEGVNVYVGASLRHPDTAPFGRSNINDYYKATALWCDLDDAAAAKNAKEKYKDLPPSFVVITGRHPNLRAQVWWKLQEPQSNKEEHKKALANVCAALNGDRAVVDPIRVMRLGGTVAWPKKEGRIPEATETTTPVKATPSVEFDTFKSYFPAVEEPVDARPSTAGEVGHKLNINNRLPAIGFEKEEWTIKQIEQMLSHIHPDSEYLDWLKVGMGLKDYGVPFDVFDTWCARGTKYPGTRELQYKWSGFTNGKGVGMGTVYYHAEMGGYHPSKYREQSIVFNTPESQVAVVVKEEIDNDGVVTEKKMFKLLYADDVVPVTETSDFVEDLLCERQFSVVYGASNCGKTFFMLDLAMHVALGMEWRGKAVKQGGVIYAALEGGHGTKNRICAFKEHYKVTTSIPLAVIPSSINFLDDKQDGDIETLVNSIKAAQEKLGGVIMIVIDTLARAISGGDENSSVDMGRMVATADYIRALTGAHIVFVHHSGKDDLKGARGHSSLRAAVDTEIEISRPDTNSPSTIKVVKQREMEMVEDMAFSLNRVVLGVNGRGKDVTSCIVTPCDIVEYVKQPVLNAVQTFLFEALIEAMIRDGKERNIYVGQPPIRCVSYDELRLVMEERGYKEMMATEKKTTAEQIKSATQTARLGLKKAQRVNFDRGYIWPIYLQENENK